MKWISIAFLLVVACGCKSKTVSIPLPALPWNYMQSKTEVPRMAELPAPRQGKVTLVWENAPSPFADHYLTGIEASTNLTQWEEVARLPYATEGTVTFTNRPPAEFYRLFNTIKQ